jgi:hypothetical protein
MENKIQKLMRYPDQIVNYRGTESVVKVCILQNI